MAHLGQHFLTDQGYLERVVEAAELAVGDKVLEIGPGRGELTEHLLAAGAHVTAIELDRGLAMLVAERFGDHERFELIQGDAAQTPWPPFHKLVSNLPYQISSPVIFELLEHDYELAVLTLQKEFADRLVAQPGTKQWSRLSAKLGLKARAERLFTIPAGAFSPPPQVTSACVRIEPAEPITARDPELLEHLIDHTFTQRRKMLRSSLKATPGARAALDAMGYATLRPAKLTPEEWAELADRIIEERA